MNFKKEPTYLERIRHSAAHILAEAVKEIYPDVLLGIGPAYEFGFYYDFYKKTPFTEQDLKQIEKLMQASIKKNSKFVQTELTKEAALKLVKGNRFKEDILESIPEGEAITYVSHSDGRFNDLCRGGHVDKTGEIKIFKLTRLAGSYWRGDEKNPQMQRIYGTAWETQEQLDEYLKLLKKAEEVDHRKLGIDMGLIAFRNFSPASPFFLPNGTTVINKILEFLRGMYTKYGYKEIITPQIFNSDLWKISGHYDNYAENMYFTEVNDIQYGIKPMNCPAAMILYKGYTHSYRVMPVRFADFGRLHRRELSGVTHGLTRVRGFSQDDAHIFCTNEQIEQEITSCLQMLKEIYEVFELNEYEFNLSLRPLKKIGNDEMWNRSEKILSKILEKFKQPYKILEGEGAFYGPKIDIYVSDMLKRRWQLGTVQLDFNQPERFDLNYINPDGQRERPVVIHRTILGSLERFLGVYTEHTEGRFPFWMTAVQVQIICIADRHLEYAQGIVKQLLDRGIRVEINLSSERMNQKILLGTKSRIPHLLIIGDKEVNQKSVTVRHTYTAKSETMSQNDYYEKATKLTEMPK